MELVRQKTPEQRELEKKGLELKALEAQLAERELALVTLRGETAAFEKRYLHILGPAYAKLDEIEAQIADAAAKLEPADPDMQAKAANARARASDSARVAEECDRSETRSEFQASETLRTLYRDVAKAMHPDLADNDADRVRRHTFMVRANEAYEAGDEDHLRSVLREWQSSPESVKGDGPGAELIRTIRKIARCEDRLALIQVEIGQIETSSLFVLKQKVEEAAKEGHDLLAQMEAHLQSEIVGAKERKAQTTPGGRA